MSTDKNSPDPEFVKVQIGDGKPHSTKKDWYFADQVGTLDEFIEWAFHAPTYTKAEYKAKLSALLVEARGQGALAHAESLTASGKQADTISEALELAAGDEWTTHKGSLYYSDKFVRELLEKQREVNNGN